MLLSGGLKALLLTRRQNAVAGLYPERKVCLTGDRQTTSKALVYKCLGPSECIAVGERIRYKPIAPAGVTLTVIKQKSADGIVAKCPA